MGCSRIPGRERFQLHQKRLAARAIEVDDGELAGTQRERPEIGRAFDAKRLPEGRTPGVGVETVGRRARRES